MRYSEPKIILISDSAFSIELANSISKEAFNAVSALVDRIDQFYSTSIVDIIPSYCSVVVEYDPLQASAKEMKALLAFLAHDLDDGPRKCRHLIEIPVCYGSGFGPDIDEVAARCGLDIEELIYLHSDPEYQVYAMGFSPGFPYLAGMDPRIAVPRLAIPRTSVKAGSVGIAGDQTGIYPMQTPGGWQLIGRTPLTLFDPFQAEPFVLSIGDAVRFIPIDENSFAELAGEHSD